MHRKVIIHPGITIEYSGPDTLVERLNTSRTINVDIILEVLSVAKVLPQIVYEYTVPKNILKNYKWSLSDWSECNYVCEGMKYRRAQCQNTGFKETVSDDYCTPEEKPQEEKQTCNSYCTLEWQVAEASECSNYCGPGNRTISTQCVQTLKNHEGQPSEPVAMHACWHIERPSNYEPCIGPCNSAHWSYGKWGTCSVTCGDGIQSRTATCIDTSDKMIDETKCITEEKIVTRICGDKICPKWSFGKWSACSVTCGIGKRIRSIWCHIENRIVDTKLCTNSTLDAQETCDAGPCYRWDTRRFKNCDTECGERRFRMIRCKDMEGNLVPDVHCSPQKKPKQLKKCHREACATSITTSETPRLRDGGKRRWRVSNWTPCSKHCGVGIQERVVTCRRVNGFGWVDPLPIDGCIHDKRPNKKRNCKLRECNDEYYWTTGKWRKCSHSCGRKGKQTRRLFCVDANGAKYARSYCPSKFKPNRERKCNQRRCGPRTCLEAQKRYKPMNDGEYTLLIGGKSMKIFCLDAATNAPREYLTLPAGDRKNYAEIYNKRLLNPNQCPFNGKRNDTCECISDGEGISGITYFQRVRINPATLTIIVDDFTFSETKGAKRVEFGKAGDCYSNATNCPQGSFNIDLTGTLLRISSDVSWVPTKSRAFLTIKRVVKRTKGLGKVWWLLWILYTQIGDEIGCTSSLITGFFEQQYSIF